MAATIGHTLVQFSLPVEITNEQCDALEAAGGVDIDLISNDDAWHYHVWATDLPKLVAVYVAVQSL